MKKILLSIIDFYQKSVSPLLPVLFGGGCRFYPSCSQYTKEAILRHGLLKGIALGMKRILCCHPFGGQGVDPAPQKLP